MARFSFRKPKTEEDGDLPESLEGDEGTTLLEDEDDSEGGRPRRLLIILGLVVILAGGGYLAWNLFLEPAPPPPPAPRPMAIPPVAKAPAPAPPAPAPATVPVPPPAKAPEAAKAPAVKPEAKPPVAPAKPEAKAPAQSAKPEAKTPVQPAKPEAKAPPQPAKSEAKAPVAPVRSAGTGSFSVQVGAMAMQENAERLRRQLEEKGYKATVRQGTAHIAKHVVTVGEFGGRREAEDTSRRLSVDGFPAQLLAADGKFAPQIGAFFSLDEAIDLARELQKKGYAPKITSRQVNTTVYQVRHGGFDSRAAAVTRGEELRAKGFATFMVVRD
jgi:cell division septation protein DedD